MKYVISDKAPKKVVGKQVREGAEVDLSPRQRDHLINMGHITPKPRTARRAPVKTRKQGG